jgi:penicillin-binding protein 1C
MAFKTGTSYGYRDAWAIGFDGRHVIGVWVGRPDGAPSHGLVGVDAAAPIMMDAFARIGPTTPLRAAPAGIVEVSAAALPEPLRRFRSPNTPRVAAAEPPEIAYPPAGARIDLGIKAGDRMPLVLKARRGHPPYTWFADGAPIGAAAFGNTLTFEPNGPGFVDLLVIDAAGASARGKVFLE